MDQDTTEYLVVVNQEQQHSIWPTFKPVPQGWQESGFRGNKSECLSHIEEVWTDMRPLSLRQALSASEH
ncbi:MbtH family protein [Endothiovibrio diazotrophicus]